MSKESVEPSLTWLRQEQMRSTSSSENDRKRQRCLDGAVRILEATLAVQ